MQLVGEWFPSDDGVYRPTILADVVLADRTAYDVRFVVDTAADCSVLSADLLPGLPPLAAPPKDLALAGVGGRAPFGMLKSALEFQRPGLAPVTVRGEFAVFTEAGALDTRVLGRDVLDHFEVIVSRRRNEVVLLAGAHRYAVHGV